MKLDQIFSVSFESLRTSNLRTFLTILGVVVGIFSIIVIMTIITMLQTTIETGFSFLSKNTFQIQKFPPIHSGGPGHMQKYRNRKNITLDDFKRLEGMLKQAKYLGASQDVYGKVIKFGGKETNPNISIVGISLGAMKTNNVTVQEGREIRQSDINFSNHVCLMGMDVVDKLFPNINPIGLTVRVDDQPMEVIGVMERQPQIFGQSMDNYVAIPITTFQSFYGKTRRSVDITVMSYSKADYDALMEATIGYMRTIRKVPAGTENDFEIFSNESLMGQINDITGGVKIGAIVISIIALIAAGVGIMNIMLVSVTERTREIGIMKAVGARKSNILLQFLIEAVVLCLIGGILGIVLGVGIGNIAGSFLNATAVIPYDWVAIGLSLCVVVGVIFGTYPAYKAANLDPIEALRYE